MKQKQWLLTGIFAWIFTLLFQATTPVHAQGGVGFGIGSFGGWGGGFWGGSGIWRNIRPNWNRGTSQDEYDSPLPAPYYNQPVQQPVISTGVLEGRIQMASNCPVQPKKACPIATMNDVTVTATPTDTTQWTSAQTNELGYYRLSLPPGNYQVKAQNPYSKAETAQSAIVQPGASTRLDMNLYSECNC